MRFQVYRKKYIVLTKKLKKGTKSTKRAFTKINEKNKKHGEGFKREFWKNDLLGFFNVWDFK